MLLPHITTLKVFNWPHLETQNLQLQISSFEQWLLLPGVLGPDQRFQQVVQVAFDPFPKHEAVISGETCRCACKTRGSDRTSW